MRTLENHLTGVTLDRPHPDSYRPDLPLRGVLQLEADGEEATEEAREEGREAGYAEGYFNGRADGDGDRTAERRKHEQEVATLRALLEAKRA